MPHHALQVGQHVLVGNVDPALGTDVTLSAPNGNTSYVTFNAPLPDQLLPVGGVATALNAGVNLIITTFNNVIVVNHGAGQLDVDW